MDVPAHYIITAGGQREKYQQISRIASLKNPGVINARAKLYLRH